MRKTKGVLRTKEGRGTGRKNFKAVTKMKGGEDGWGVQGNEGDTTKA